MLVRLCWWAALGACVGAAVPAAAQERFRFSGDPGERLYAWRLSPDANVVYTVSSDGVDAWDVNTGAKTPLRELGKPRCLSLSPDGKVLAAGYESGPDLVKFWDVQAGKVQGALPGPGDLKFGKIPFSADGRFLLTPGQQDPDRVWEVAGGKPRCTMPPGADHAWFLPDGKSLAAWIPAKGDEGAVLKRFDVDGKETGSVTFPKGDGSRKYAFGPDGRTVAVADKGMIALWDLETGRPGKTWKAHEFPVGALAFAPDGKALASAADDAFHKEVRTWDASTGELKGAWSGTDFFIGFGSGSLAFSPDGRQLAIGGSALLNLPLVVLWSPADDQQSMVLAPGWHYPFKGYVQGVAFAPQGKRLLVEPDPQWNTFGVSDVPDPDRRRAVLRGHAGAVTAVTFGGDGALLASASCDRTVRLWDAAAGKQQALLLGHTGLVLGLALSPDGKTLATASADRTVRLWDVAARKERAVLTGHTADVMCVAYSPDGKTLASGGRDGTVRLWDPETGAPLAVLGQPPPAERCVAALTAAAAPPAAWNVVLHAAALDADYPGHMEEVFALAFSADGRTLAAGGGDFWRPDLPGLVHLWDVPARRRRAALAGLPYGVNSLAFLPDGRTLVAGGSCAVKETGGIQFWDAQTGKELDGLVGRIPQVHCLAVSPDGKTLAVGAAREPQPQGPGAVSLWDLATRRPAGVASPYDGGVLAVAFAPDGKTLASGGFDRAIRVWAVGGQESGPPHH